MCEQSVTRLGCSTLLLNSGKMPTRYRRFAGQNFAGMWLTRPIRSTCALLQVFITFHPALAVKAMLLLRRRHLAAKRRWRLMFYDEFCVFLFFFFFFIFWRDCSAIAGRIFTKSSSADVFVVLFINDGNPMKIGPSRNNFGRLKTSIFGKENSNSARKRGGILGKLKHLV